MDRDIQEACEELSAETLAVSQIVKQLDQARGMVQASWDGEAADVYAARLEKITSDMNHSARVIDNIAAQLVQKG